MSSILIDNFIRQLKELENGSLWFDQSLKGKLDNLATSTAFNRPPPSVHSIAEHVAHMLAWRRECIVRLNGGYTDMMDSQADWQPVTKLNMIGWTVLKNLLYESTIEMIGLIEGKNDAYLDTVFRDTEYMYEYLIEGIIEHDIYHLGQIGVTFKLLQTIPESNQSGTKP